MCKIFVKSWLTYLQIIYQNGGIYLDTDSVSLHGFGPTFWSDSFVSFTLSPWNNICNSVFGFPQASHFLQFVLQSAELNAVEGDYLENPVIEELFGPTFFTSMFVSFLRYETTRTVDIADGIQWFKNSDDQPGISCSTFKPVINVSGNYRDFIQIFKQIEKMSDKRR